jgi:S1-C subfamily serine protease
MKYNPGDKVTLKVLRQNKEFSIDVILGERSE